MPSAMINFFLHRFDMLSFCLNTKNYTRLPRFALAQAVEQQFRFSPGIILLRQELGFVSFADPTQQPQTVQKNR